MDNYHFIKTKFTYLLPLIAAILAWSFYVLSEMFAWYGIKPYMMWIFVNILWGIFLLLINLKGVLSFKIEKKDIWKLLISSLFWFALWYFFLYQAIDFIWSSKTSFLVQIEPIFIFILSILFLWEKFSFKNLFSLLIILWWVFLILFDPSLLNISLSSWELFSMLSWLCFAVGIVSIASIISKYNEVVITWLQMLIWGLFLFGFVPIRWFDFKLKFLIPLSILGIIIWLSWLFYNLWLKFLWASKTAIIYTSKSFIVFLFAILASNIFLGISFKLPKNIGMFVLWGIVILAWIIFLKYETKKTNLNDRKFATSLLWRKKLFEQKQIIKNK